MNFGKGLVANFQDMSLEEALDYCYEHKAQYLKSSEEGEEEFNCLVSCLESGHILPSQLPEYGMKY